MAKEPRDPPKGWSCACCPDADNAVQCASDGNAVPTGMAPRPDLPSTTAPAPKSGRPPIAPPSLVAKHQKLPKPEDHLVSKPTTFAPTLVLLPTIGTDHHIWDILRTSLPSELTVVCPDLPGHAYTPSLPGPGKIGAYVSAVEATLDRGGHRDVVFLGHGVGGLIAQGLAAKRLDLVRALVLSGTATKIETRDRWAALADALRHDGVDAFVRHIATRWRGTRTKGNPFPSTKSPTSDSVSAEALAHTAEAASGADFYTTTAALRLPTLVLVGARDCYTPPDLARETATLIPGSQFAMVSNAGHFAMLDAPVAYAARLMDFLAAIGVQSQDTH